MLLVEYRLPPKNDDQRLTDGIWKAMCDPWSEQGCGFLADDTQEQPGERVAPQHPPGKGRPPNRRIKAIEHVQKSKQQRGNQQADAELDTKQAQWSSKSLDNANAFLEEFREDFNRRFAVAPRSSHDAHRPLLKTENLDFIFTHQKTGTLSKNLTMQSKNVIYQIQSDRPDYALRHAQVMLCENAQGEVTIFYKDTPWPIPFTTSHPARVKWWTAKPSTTSSSSPNHLPPPITLGAPMASISMANPSRRPLPMSQTNMLGALSFALFPTSDRAK
jgi:hypothetical protein